MLMQRVSCDGMNEKYQESKYHTFLNIYYELNLNDHYEYDIWEDRVEEIIPLSLQSGREFQ